MVLRKYRWLRLLLTVPILMLTPLHSAWALGLSEIEVDSALNEKFSASIELLDTGDLGDGEIIVSLASQEDFERIGVERFFFLTDLEFSVDHGGAPRIVVSSGKAISEPYLNFIVEVLWPKGRLLKEYTVLLDPPTFTAAAAPSVTAPAAASEPAAQPRRADRVRLSDARPAPSRAAQRQPSQDSGGALMTSTDDTLWKIAQRTLPSDRVSVNQQMVAIQRLNPQAFIRNNINLLKAGYELEIPSESQALELNNSDALAEVRAQAESWRSGDAQQSVAQADAESGDLAAQVDATGDVDASPAATQGSEQGQVRIVANSGDLSQGTAETGDAGASQLLEENDALNRQVDELNYQLDREKELAAQEIQLKERQLEVKDQALAELQQRVAQMEESLKAQQQQLEQQNQGAPSRTEPLPWWQSPMLLGGVIVVLVLLLAYLLLGARRKRDEEDDYIPADVEPEPVYNETDIEPTIGEDLPMEEDVVEADPTDDLAEELAETDLSADEADDLDDLDLSEGEDEVPMPEGDGDVIAEADIYIAYGRYGQAVTLLQGTLAKEPEAHEVRLKMLEVCVEAEDPDQFAEHAEYLVENCSDEDILLAVRELEGRMSDNVATLDDLGSDENDAETAAEAAADDDFQLEFDAGDDSDEQAVLSDDDLEGLDLDGLDEGEAVVELDATEDEPSDSASDEQTDHSDDLGGDLGIDFDDSPESPAAEEANVASDASAAEGDNSLGDFDFADDGDADVNATKLDLAEAYIDMGDGDGARDILNEVLNDGSEEQVAKAQELLDGIKD